MQKDKRHKTVKILIETGNVTTFSDIFEHIPKTNVADDLGIHFNRMAKMLEKIGDMKIDELFLLSAYFEVDPKIIFQLVQNQKEKKKK